MTMTTTPAPAGKIGKLMRFAYARMSEASTYRGLFILLSALGLAVPDEWGHAITTFGLAVAGLIGLFMSDKAPATPGHPATGSPQE